MDSPHQNLGLHKDQFLFLFFIFFLILSPTLCSAICWKLDTENQIPSFKTAIPEDPTYN
jgi:hypothetical protein